MKPVEVRVKIEALLEHIYSNYSQREIAAKCKVSQSMVRNLKKKLQNGTQFSGEGSDRKRITTRREDRKIMKIAEKMRKQSLNKIRQAVLDSNIKISQRTLRRRLKTAGLTAHTQTKKQKLTEAIQVKRKSWAKNFG